MVAPTTTYNPDTKIWSGTRQKSLRNWKIPLGEVILSSLSREPNKIIQITPLSPIKFYPDLQESLFYRLCEISDNSGVHLTKADIKERAIAITKWLIQKGCRRNDVIGLIARNSENVAPLAVAALVIGAPINSLDAAFSKKEIVHMFSYTKPKFIFCDEDKYDEVQASIEKLELGSNIFTLSDKRNSVMSIAQVIETSINEDLNNFSLPKIEDGSKQIAFILCSSGTTGLPKGVCLSHAGLYHDLGSIPSGKNDVRLCFSSLYWISGVKSLLSGLIGGVPSIITNEPFTPEKLLRMIEQYKVTIAFSPPSQVALCLQSPDIETRDLSSIRQYFCGGSQVPIVLRDKMNSYLKNGCVIVVYGMSELGRISSMVTASSKIGSVGRLFNDINVKIHDNDGHKLGVGEQGEILVQSMFHFMGYYGRPDDSKNIVNKGGWIRTGDIGYFDDDGFLFLVDRKKDILKYKNYPFSPSEIEEEILKVPGICQAIACGVPDLVATDLPAALVIKENDSEVSESQIYEHFASNVSDPKQLRGGVYFVNSFPVTPSGKYIRSKAKEIASYMYNNRIK